MDRVSHRVTLQISSGFDATAGRERYPRINAHHTDASMIISTLAVAACLALPQSCSSSTMTTTLAGARGEPGNIVQVADSAGDFQTLLAAATEAGLAETLQSEGPFTIFAPNDAAFAKLPAGTVETLLKPENKAQLVAILTYHVVPGKLGSGEVLKKSALPTANGQRLPVKMVKGAPTVGNVGIVATDVEAANGVIHVVDEVMIPQTKDIVGVATEAGSFKTLAAALAAADLVEVLQGTGPFTVMAPTDEAFAKLPAGTVESLLKPENKDKLRTILLYHVVPGRVYADQVVTLTSAPTAADIAAPIVVKKNAKGTPVVTVDGATVVATDIEASNGVIHVIDSVILPD